MAAQALAATFKRVKGFKLKSYTNCLLEESRKHSASSFILGTRAENRFVLQ